MRKGTLEIDEKWLIAYNRYIAPALAEMLWSNDDAGWSESTYCELLRNAVITAPYEVNEYGKINNFRLFFRAVCQLNPKDITRENAKRILDCMYTLSEYYDIDELTDWTEYRNVLNVGNIWDKRADLFSICQNALTSTGEKLDCEAEKDALFVYWVLECVLPLFRNMYTEDEYKLLVECLDNIYFAHY